MAASSGDYMKSSRPLYYGGSSATSGGSGRGPAYYGGTTYGGSAYYYGSLGSRTLKRTYPCMSGADVRTLQTMLNALGYSCGRVDGKFGDRTKAAVIAFQRRNGLKVDGIVGRATKTRLLSRYRNRR